MKYKHSNELYHHGIKGQRWGIRRFQREDGTRTPAGRARARRELSDEEKQSVIRKASTDRTYARAASGEYRNQLTKNIVDETGRIIGNLKRENDDYIRNNPVKKKRLNLDNMSDQDMRNKINRELLERQYNQLFAPEDYNVNKGRETVSKVLGVAGTALATASSALTIALAIKQLRNS